MLWAFTFIRPSTITETGFSRVIDVTYCQQTTYDKTAILATGKLAIFGTFFDVSVLFVHCFFEDRFGGVPGNILCGFWDDF